MFRSATAKLTAWYLGIVMVISLGFSVVVYHFAINELNFGLNHQTERIYRQFPAFNGNPGLQVRDSDISLGAHHIFLQLAYFNVLVLAGAGFTSYWLARRTLEPIEAAHDRQKRFTADVSHELRTPLTSLKMSSEVALLDKQANKEELRKALQSNIEDASRMGQLVNNLLRLTKLDGEQLGEVFANIQSEAVLRDALERVQAAADDKKINFKQTTVSATVYGDADLLTQLVVILLDNAVKYSPAKSTIAISSKPVDGLLQLKIKDNGPGIAPEALPHVFERFYREDTARTTNTSGNGYGLGLSIAKMIADRSNVAIDLRSKAGKGTTAIVSLPLAVSTEQPNQS